MSDPGTEQRAAEPEPPIRVAQNVIKAMEELPRDQAEAVARAIRLIGRRRGEPIWFPVPDAPNGSKFLALVPDDNPSAPAVIYRRMLESEGNGNGWRVAALMDRDDYDDYRSAEKHGFFHNPVAQEAVTAATLAEVRRTLR